MKSAQVACVCALFGALLTVGCRNDSSTTALGMISTQIEQEDSSWGAIRGAWGPDDQRGAMNRITPDTVARAARLIQTGKIYSLGRVYEPGMPLFGERHYRLSIPGAEDGHPTGGPMGPHNIVWHDELVSGQIGQIGTPLDRLAHRALREPG